MRVRRKILISISLLVASVVFFGGGIWWARQSSSQLLVSILEGRQVLAQNAFDLIQLDALRRQQQEVARTIVALERAMPPRGELVTLPARLAALGEGLGVNSSATFGPEEAGKDGKPSSIELSIFSSGTLDDIRVFIAELERASQPIIDVRGFDFSRSVDPRRFQGVIRAKVFFRP